MCTVAGQVLERFHVFFDENLQPTARTNGQCLTTSTLQQYIGQHLSDIRKAHPKHPDFCTLHREDYPQWWTHLRQCFVRESDRFQMTLGDDVRFGAQPIRPLYRVNKNQGMAPVDDTGKLEDYISAIDLRFVLMKLLKGAKGRGVASNPFEKRAQLNLTASAVGHAGEVKFQDFSLWSFDPFLNIFDPYWMELKTLMGYPVPMVPDNLWVICIYHSLGAYWLMENGLWRSPEQIAQGKKNCVFPSLHSIRAESVGKKLTTIIRDNLPSNTPDDIAKRFSAKSTRIGAITALCNHKDMNVLRVCARSGHSTGANVDSYRDLSDVAGGMPAAKALHGYRNIDADVVLYSFEVLGQVDISKFIDELFACNIDLFMPGGALRPILITAAASLVTYHEEVTKDLGYDNPLSTKLRDTARKVKLKDPNHPHATPEAILSYWSKKMLTDFRSKSAAAPATQPEIGAIAKTLDALTAALNTMSNQIAELVQQHSEVVRENSAQSAAIASLQEENARLLELQVANQRRVQKQKQKLAELESVWKTPSPSARKRKRLSNCHDETNKTATVGIGDASFGEADISPIEFSLTAAEDCDLSAKRSALADEIRDELEEATQKPTVAASVQRQQLKRADDSGAFVAQKQGALSSKKSRRQGAPRLLDCLIHLQGKGFLKSEFDFKACGAKKGDMVGVGVSDMSFVNYCLELCDFVISGNNDLKEAKQKLCDIKSTNAEVRTSAHTIETACYNKIHDMLGKSTVEIAKDPKARGKKTINSFGRLVIDFKKLVQRLEKYEGTKKYANLPLMERAELERLQRAEVSESNRSITSFFTPRSR